MSISAFLNLPITQHKRIHGGSCQHRFTQVVSACLGFGTIFCGTSASFADVLSDLSTGSIVDNSSCLGASPCNLRGGQQQGDNLFHSFSQFVIPSGGRALLNTPSVSVPSNVENIFIRVTGAAKTQIDGQFSVNESLFLNSPDIYFLSPQGIDVGHNAQLFYPGNFLFTTAERLDFGGGAIFDATSSSPLLTLSGFDSFPNALQLGNASGEINFNSQIGFDNVEISQTQSDFSIIGGVVNFEDINIPAFGGINVASVGPNQSVDLSLLGANIEFDYSNVSDFKNVTLNNSQIFTKSQSGLNSAGSIEIVGDTLVLMNSGKVISGFNDFNAGSIYIHLNETLTLSNQSEIATVSSLGNVGDLNITARTLKLSDQSFVLSRSHQNVANLTIDSTGNTALNSGSFILLEMTETSSVPAGELQVTGSSLTLDGNSRILHRTPDGGGSLSLNFVDDVSISNGSQLGAFLTNNGRDNLKGDSGNIDVTAKNFVLSDASFILTETAKGKGDITLALSGDLSVSGSATRQSEIKAQLPPNATTGGAGEISISANDISFDRTLLSSSTDQPGGSINITSANRIQFDQSEIRLSSSTGTGHAGNLSLTAQSTMAPVGISLIDTDLFTEATNTGGSVVFTTPGEVELQNGSSISIDSSGVGGNFTVSASAFRSNSLSADNDVFLSQGTLDNLSLPTEVTGFDLLANQVVTNGNSELLPAPRVSMVVRPPGSNLPALRNTLTAIVTETLTPGSESEADGSGGDRGEGESRILSDASTFHIDDDEPSIRLQFYGSERRRRCTGPAAGRLRVSGRGGIVSMPSSLGGSSATLSDFGMIDTAHISPVLPSGLSSPIKPWVEAETLQRDSQGKITLLARSQRSPSIPQEDRCQSIHDRSG